MSGDAVGLVRSSSVMAVGTVLSRVTGMLAKIALFAAIGGGVFADTYNVANALPNIVYILLVGGALNAVFVPQLVRHMKDDADDGTAFAQRLVTATTVVLVVLSALAVLLAPLIVRLYATARWSADDFALSTAFARYCLPQILFYGLYTLFSQVLNARDHFAAPMFAPVLNNVVVIVTAVLFAAVVVGPPSSATITPSETALLGLGTTLGIVVQAFVLVPVLWRTGFRLRLRWDLRGTGLGTVTSLAKWTIALVAFNQVGLLFVTRLATAAAVAEGGKGAGYTVYMNAYLLFMLPQSVVTVSVVTALLPSLSRLAHAGEMAAVRSQLSQALRLTGVVIVPAAAALVVLGPQIGVLLFAYGASSVTTGALLGLTVTAFALGLPAFSAYYVLLRGFYALEDTRTPAMNALLLNACNIGFAFLSYALLPAGLRVPGLALAFSAAYAVALTLLWQRLRRRTGGLDSAEVVRTYVRTGLAALLGGLAAWSTSWLAGRSLDPGPSRALVMVCVGVVAGGAVYLLLARAMRIRELEAVVALVLRRGAG